MTAVADADSYAFQQNACMNNGRYANLETTVSYYQNGQIASVQTPAERADGVSSTASYDADGNLISETHHFGSTNAATTTRWYDGADRLVEVQLPQDSTDIFSSWLTRYIYDLSGSGSNGSYHGNLAAIGDLWMVRAKMVELRRVGSRDGHDVPRGSYWIYVSIEHTVFCRTHEDLDL